MVKTPKALFHPDGGLYVVWHRSQQAYAPIISDEHVPPRPGIDITFLDHGVTDQEALVWRPIRMSAVEMVATEEALLFPYDPDTGSEA